MVCKSHIRTHTHTHRHEQTIFTHTLVHALSDAMQSEVDTVSGATDVQIYGKQEGSMTGHSMCNSHFTSLVGNKHDNN